MITLTPRQTQIVDCLLKGMSNKEIARVLGIAHGTVKVHIHLVFEKLADLGITSRGKLVAHYRDGRLINLTADTPAPEPAPRPPRPQ